MSEPMKDGVSSSNASTEPESIALPSTSEKLYEFLKNLNAPIDEKERIYARALSQLKDDLFSLYIFFDYTEMLMVGEDFRVIDKIYTCHRSKFKRYHLFWKKSIEFSVVYLKKDFDHVHNKIISYLNLNDFASRKEILEYLQENKEKLNLNQNKKIYSNKYADIPTPGSDKRFELFNNKENVKNQPQSDYTVISSQIVDTDIQSDVLQTYNIQSDADQLDVHQSDKFQSNVSMEQQIDDKLFSRKNDSELEYFDKQNNDDQINNEQSLDDQIDNKDDNNSSDNDKLQINIVNTQTIKENQAKHFKENQAKHFKANDFKPSKAKNFKPSKFEFSLLENTQPLDISTPKFTILNNKKYTILERIGKGGFSAVHKVLHNNKIYALKKASKGDFDREISILKKFNNCNSNACIINMIDYQIDMLSNTVIILLEYGEIDLQTYINNFTYTNCFIKYTSETILRIIDFLHSSQIIHKDVKPANFVFVKGRLKIIDFGISAEIGPDTTSCLNNKEGTAYYSSPEVFLMQKVSRSADIWSFGCILHYLIYKQTVFSQDDILKIREILINRRPIEFKKLDRNNKPVDQYALDLMKCCLCYDANERKKAKDLLQYHPYFQ